MDEKHRSCGDSKEVEEKVELKLEDMDLGPESRKLQFKVNNILSLSSPR